MPEEIYKAEVEQRLVGTNILIKILNFFTRIFPIWPDAPVTRILFIKYCILCCYFNLIQKIL